MLIQVTNTSQSLEEILKEEQLEAANLTRNQRDANRIFIQNLDASIDIYIDAGLVATVGSGVKIAANGGTLEIRESTLSDINLIADGISNSNIRIFMN